MRTNGITVRYVRTLKGLTQTQCAADAGITQGHWANVEAGRHQPSEDVAAAMCRAIGIDDLRVVMGPDNLPVVPVPVTP